MSEKQFDLMIRGGTVVSGRASEPADIGITDGKIEMVAPDLADASATQVIDASGKLVLPGVIDAHVHPFYDDDLEGISISGLHGGVTTLVPYVGPNPAW